MARGYARSIDIAAPAKELPALDRAGEGNVNAIAEVIGLGGLGMLGNALLRRLGGAAPVSATAGRQPGDDGLLKRAEAQGSKHQEHQDHEDTT